MTPTLASAALDAAPFSDAEASYAPAPEPTSTRWYHADHALDREVPIDQREWLHLRIDLDLLEPPS